MARADVSERYRKLVDNTFYFMPSGRQNIKDICHHVKSTYPKLCDDTFRCYQNC